MWNVLFIMVLLSSTAYGQSVVDDISAPVEPYGSTSTFVENVERISNSKKIFIISNQSNELHKGDFISLLVEDELAIRALVAKVKNNSAGIKILKIYSLTQWGKIKTGLDVKIIKGDDSYYVKGKNNSEKQGDSSSEGLTEDLVKSDLDEFGEMYGAESLQDELGLSDRGDRIIKPDNIVTAGFTTFKLHDSYDGSKDFSQWSVQWAYQIKANIWIEGVFASTLQPVRNFPGPDIETSITDYIGRIKYIFQAPIYSYFMPYLGFHFRSVNSPEAGASSRGGLLSAADREAELQTIDELQGVKVAVGITWIKRLVPGWFLHFNAGTDRVDAGFAIEF